MSTDATINHLASSSKKNFYSVRRKSVRMPEPGAGENENSVLKDNQPEERLKAMKQSVTTKKLGQKKKNLRLQENQSEQSEGHAATQLQEPSEIQTLEESKDVRLPNSVSVTGQEKIKRCRGRPAKLKENMPATFHSGKRKIPINTMNKTKPSTRTIAEKYSEESHCSNGCTSEKLLLRTLGDEIYLCRKDAEFIKGKINMAISYSINYPDKGFNMDELHEILRSSKLQIQRCFELENRDDINFSQEIKCCTCKSFNAKTHFTNLLNNPATSL